jgi:hypothetical protein
MNIPIRSRKKQHNPNKISVNERGGLLRTGVPAGSVVNNEVGMALGVVWTEKGAPEKESVVTLSIGGRKIKTEVIVSRPKLKMRAGIAFRMRFLCMFSISVTLHKWENATFQSLFNREYAV